MENGEVISQTRLELEVLDALKAYKTDDCNDRHMSKEDSRKRSRGESVTPSGELMNVLIDVYCPIDGCGWYAVINRMQRPDRRNGANSDRIDECSRKRCILDVFSNTIKGQAKERIQAHLEKIGRAHV